MSDTSHVFSGQYEPLTAVEPVSYALFNEDCLARLSQLEGDSVDLILTDPPYNLGLFMKNRNAGVSRLRKNHFIESGWDNQDNAEWVVSMSRFLEESFRILKNNGTLLVFMSVIKLETIIELAQDAGFYYKTVGIWHKTNPIPRNMNRTFINSTEAWIYFVKGGPSGTFNNNKKAIHDFYESGLTPASEKKHGSHPTQKPLKLFSHFVNVLSNPQDVVVDPFMGSGTAALASILNGRSFIGIEINDNYFSIAKNRLFDFL